MLSSFDTDTSQASHASFVTTKQTSTGVTLSLLYSGKVAVAAHDGTQQVVVTMDREDAEQLLADALKLVQG